MRALHKILPILTACVCLAAAPALARSGAEIKTQFDAGVAAYDAGDYAKAYALWIDLQYEDIAAMRNAAMLLRKGQGVEKDPRHAESLYQRAAEAGLPTAQADLADMLLKGEAGPPDLASALPLLEAAAAANHPVAQFQLGEFYETGAPPLVPQNYEVARQLYTNAASHGMKEAADRLRALPPEVAKINAPEAAKMVPPEAAKGEPPAPAAPAIPPSAPAAAVAPKP